MLFPKLLWNEYFTGTPETTLHRNKYISRQTPSVSSVYISNCLFDKCTIESGNGGALFCSTSVTYLIVESSSFFSCKAINGASGAIYFSNTGSGQSILYAVCGNDCSSASYGFFARILINNAASSKNYANYTSIVRCVNDTSSFGQILRLENGKSYCPLVNISMNICSGTSGINLTPLSDSSSVTSSLLYSTLANNSAIQRSCIWCNTDGAKYEIKCCNIIRNTQGNFNLYGTIFSRGNLVIEDSCILENIANYIFYQESTSYTITLSNCTVDSTSHYYSLVIQNTAAKSFIHGLNHISTQNCHSEYDSAGILTAVPHVSQSTKTIFCHTFNHYQARISDSFPLNCLFIFAFIHSNPYGHCL
jgi:hypothetical protein